MGNDFEALFLAEYFRVLCIAQRILRNSTEAEEVAVEVAVAFRREHSTLPKDSPVHLHRTTVQAALHRARGQRDRQPSRSSDTGGREESGAVREAMARMPGNAAAVLALRSSRLTYAETAAVLGIEVEEVAPLLRRAELMLLEEVST